MTDLERPGSPPNPLSDDEKLDLAIALAKRPNLFDLGLARMRQQYPAAPDTLLQSGAYHLYAELAGAFIDVLAQIELTFGILSTGSPKCKSFILPTISTTGSSLKLSCPGHGLILLRS